MRKTGSTIKKCTRQYGYFPVIKATVIRSPTWLMHYGNKFWIQDTQKPFIHFFIRFLSCNYHILQTGILLFIRWCPETWTQLTGIHRQRPNVRKFWNMACTGLKRVPWNEIAKKSSYCQIIHPPGLFHEIKITLSYSFPTPGPKVLMGTEKGTLSCCSWGTL